MGKFTNFFILDICMDRVERKMTTLQSFLRPWSKHGNAQFFNRDFEENGSMERVTLFLNLES